MITPLKDMFLVSANERENETTKSGLFLDTTWDKYKHAVQNGIIESIPHRISKTYKNDVELKRGDKVYFHHFVVQPDNYMMDGGERRYKALYSQIYCKIEDGAPVMLEDYVLSTPIMETEEDIKKTFGDLTLYTKTTTGKKPLVAKVEYLSKTAQEHGLKIGDTIIYKSDADYDMLIEGREYYRMKLFNVGAVIRNGNIIPMNDEVIVEDTFRDENTTSTGIILINLKPEKTQQTRIYSKGINSIYGVGDEILYFYGTGTRVEYEGKRYCILKQEQVMGVMQEA